MSGEEVQYACLYFGFASNLSARTMKQRCPESAYCGLARLDGWKWFINDTGYANIIPSPDEVVYGGLFFLTARDEAALDRSEGTPWLYEKHRVKVTRLDKTGQALKLPNGSQQLVEATAYVDIQRTSPGKINQEYIIWVNRAVRDAAGDGLPAEYTEKYIRPFAPAREETKAEASTIMLRLPYVMQGNGRVDWSAFGSGRGLDTLDTLDKTKQGQLG